jgi:2-octaprenyl-6-methoxyphenol hydroxylase
MPRVDLAIIGGGLVGASLALALQATARQRGWRIALIEPFAPESGYQPSFDARSTALSYGSARIYQQLGLWPALAERATAIQCIHVSEQGGFAAARMHAAEQGVPALGYVLENTWLGHCLWQALDREVIQWRCPAQVQRMQALEDGYRLTLDDQSHLDCALAVLADGGRSELRQQLGIEVVQRPYPQAALIANVRPARPHQGQAFERFTAQGPLAMLPLSDNRCALVWARPPEDAQRLLQLDPRGFLSELQAAFGFRLGALLHVGGRTCYPLALSTSTEQVRRHLLVLGNAAHNLHPVAGQGFNLSLRDVRTLADTLLGAEAAFGDLATLQRYQHAQRADQAWTLAFSDRLTRLFSNNQPLLAGARGLGLLGLELLAPAKRWFTRQAMGLGTRGGVL